MGGRGRCGSAGPAAGLLVAVLLGGCSGSEDAPDAGTVRDVEVGPELATCEGEGVHPCFVVVWEGDDEPTFLMDPIEGFQHEEGVTSRLRVRVVPVAEPAADASSLRYELVEVLGSSP